MKFQLGDRVAIKKTSQYFGQHSGYGIVTDNSNEAGLTYTVTWDDGYTNSYGVRDLFVLKDWDN